MAVRVVNFSATCGGSPLDLFSGSVSFGYRDASSTFSLVTKLDGLALVSGVIPNDITTIIAGFDGSTDPLMTEGLVDRVVPARSGEGADSGTITITGRDKLKQPIEYWLAPLVSGSPSLTLPAGTSLEDAIGLVLVEAGMSLSDYDPDPSMGTLAFDVPLSILSSMDVITEIQHLNNWKVWVKPDGDIRYADIKPMPPTLLPSAGSIINIYAITYDKSDDWLRNRIVVFGTGSYVAVASAVSPYLPPPPFYKTGAIGMPNFGTDQGQVDTVAALTLTLTNRLTERVHLTTDGDPAYWIGYKVTVSEAYTGVSGDWAIYSGRHYYSPEDGYLCDLELVR